MDKRKAGLIALAFVLAAFLCFEGVIKGAEFVAVITEGLHSL